MVDKLIKDIKAKFIENFDEGLLLSDSFPNEFKEFQKLFNWIVEFMNEHTHFYRGSTFSHNIRLSESLKGVVKKKYELFWAYFYIPGEFPKNSEDFVLSKKNLILLLAYPFIKNLRIKGEGFVSFAIEADLVDNIKDIWNPKAAKVSSILANAPDFLKHENIGATDKVVINVGYRSFGYEGQYSHHPKLINKIDVINKEKRYHFVKKSDCKEIEDTFADIFIVNSKYFIKLSLGEKGMIDRTENIISRDIKKLNIAQGNLLEIYFHGHYDPETIVLDDYSEALNLQRHITELREKRTVYEGKRS